MANKFFYVHNGLTVGPLAVDATTGNLATSGTIITTSTTAVNSTNSGALQVVGGVGVGGGMVIGGITTVTNTTAATDQNSGALQVDGGVGINGSLYAGNIYDNGNRVVTTTGLGGAGVGSITPGTDTAVTTSTGAVTIWNTSTLQTITGRGATTDQAISITNTSAVNSTNTGALKVSGGVGIAGSVFVGGNVTATNFVGTATWASWAVNAITATTATSAATAYSWVGGTVPNPVTFSSAVTFNGTATFVNSTNTVYTDNILELHTPPGGIGSQWTSNDGKDIGFRFHYYTNSTDTNAALVLDQTAGSLEWYSSGAESTASTFTTATYGTFKTGAILLDNTTTNAGNATSGALQVKGGVGVGGSIFVSGNVTATTFIGALTGTASQATAATNISGGVAGAIPIQSGANTTLFIAPGTSGQLLQMGTTTATWVSTSTYVIGNAVSVLNAPTITAANYYLHFVANNTATYQTPGTTSTVYVDPSTGYLTATRFVGSGAGLSATSVPNSALQGSGQITVSQGTGIGVSGSPVALGGTVTITNFGVTSFSGGSTGLTPNSATTGSVTLAGTLALANGGTNASLTASSGSVVYGTAAGMAFNTAGTAGQLLTSGGTGAPTFISTGTLKVGLAVTADNATTATSAAIAYSLGNTSTTKVGLAVTADNATTATSAAIAYSLGNTSTTKVGLAVTADNATTATSAAIAYSLGNTSTTRVGFADSATNVSSGLAGQIPYQTAPGVTGFVNSGTTGQILLATTNGAPSFTSTGSIRVAYADIATNLSGGYVNATTGQFSGVSTFSNTVIVSSAAVVYDQTGVSVGTSTVTIDTFALATYRSAKYVITVSNTGTAAYQSTEVLVIHDGSTPYLQDVSVFTGAAPIMTFTVTTATTNVILQGVGTAANNTVKVQKIYTTV